MVGIFLAKICVWLNLHQTINGLGMIENVRIKKANIFFFYVL